MPVLELVLNNLGQRKERQLVLLCDPIFPDPVEHVLCGQAPFQLGSPSLFSMAEL